MSIMMKMIEKHSVQWWNDGGMNEQIALQIDDMWYTATARDGYDLEHALHVFGHQGNKILRKEDTGLCGNQAIVTRPTPIESYHARRETQPPAGLVQFRWNPGRREFVEIDPSAYNSV